jgi:hypothetical protein
MDRQAFFLGKSGERITWPAFLVRRTEHGNNILAALQKPFQDRLTKSLLPVNYDAHVVPSQLCTLLMRTPLIHYSRLLEIQATVSAMCLWRSTWT